MPRRCKSPYSKDQLDAAVDEFSKGGKSRRQVAKIYGIPESTLRDHTGKIKISIVIIQYFTFLKKI